MTDEEYQEADRQAMALLSSQPDAALKVLRRHEPALRATLRKYLFSQHDVEDALQDVWIKLLEKSHTYDPAKGRVSTWLTTVCQRRAIDYGRRIMARSSMEDRYEASIPAVRLEDCEEETVEGNELQATLQEALDHLPESQRQVMELRYWHGLSQRKIADRLNEPLGTIKTRLELAHKKLRQILIPVN